MKNKPLKPNKLELSLGVTSLILIALGLGLALGLSSSTSVSPSLSSSKVSNSTKSCPLPGPTPKPGRCKWHSSGGGACNSVAKSLCNSQLTDKDCYAQGEYLNRKSAGDGDQCTCCWAEGGNADTDLYDDETPSYCPDISSLQKRVCRPLPDQDFMDPGNCINCNNEDIYQQYPPGGWYQCSECT